MKHYTAHTCASVKKLHIPITVKYYRNMTDSLTKI